MSELLVVKDRVQRALHQVFSIVNISDNGFTVPYESTMCWIDCWEVSDAESREFRNEMDLPCIILDFWAMVAMGVRGTNDLFEWVATEGQGYDFGGIKASKRDDGLYNVIYEYAIAGESVDPMEVKNALISVCTTADKLDEEIVRRFGGSRWVDG